MERMRGPDIMILDFVATAGGMATSIRETRLGRDYR